MCILMVFETMFLEKELLRHFLKSGDAKRLILMLFETILLKL